MCYSFDKDIFRSYRSHNNDNTHIVIFLFNTCIPPTQCDQKETHQPFSQRRFAVTPFDYSLYITDYDCILICINDKMLSIPSHSAFLLYCFPFLYFVICFTNLVTNCTWLQWRLYFIFYVTLLFAFSIPKPERTFCEGFRGPSKTLVYVTVFRRSERNQFACSHVTPASLFVTALPDAV